MKNYFDVAIYLISEIKERNIDKDPMDVGAEIARKLRLRSTDGEEFLAIIWHIKDLELDPRIVADAQSTINTNPEYTKIKEFFVTNGIH